jgi:hypothetical protein
MVVVNSQLSPRLLTADTQSGRGILQMPPRPALPPLPVGPVAKSSGTETETTNLVWETPAQVNTRARLGRGSDGARTGLGRGSDGARAELG